MIVTNLKKSIFCSLFVLLSGCQNANSLYQVNCELTDEYKKVFKMINQYCHTSSFSSDDTSYIEDNFSRPAATRAKYEDYIRKYYDIGYELTRQNANIVGDWILGRAFNENYPNRPISLGYNLYPTSDNKEYNIAHELAEQGIFDDSRRYPGLPTINKNVCKFVGSDSFNKGSLGEKPITFVYDLEDGKLYQYNTFKEEWFPMPTKTKGVGSSYSQIITKTTFVDNKKKIKSIQGKYH